MFFEIVGMIVTCIVALALIALIIILIKDFICYQRGARNMREYAYSGPDRSEWYWTKYGIRDRHILFIMKGYFIMKLIKVSFEEAIEGEEYLTEMKHGWISGQWDPEEKVCRGYYWRDMEWYPHALYRIVEDD